MNRRSFSHNPKLKGMALFLAVLTWGIVSQITNNDKVIPDIPVRITTPEGWAIRDKDSNTVQVTFRGTREDLFPLDSRNVQVQIDLRDESFSPEKTIELRPRLVAYPSSNARITTIQPETLTLRLSREGQKQLPVLVTQTGTPPDGLRLEALVVEPGMVTLTGAEELLDQINTVQTAPLNLSDRIRSFEQRLDVQLPHPDWVGRVTPSRVQVRATLSGYSEERRFEDIPLKLTFSAPNISPPALRVSPSRVTVFLRGSAQLLDPLTPNDIQALASADGLNDEGETTARVHVLVPAGVEVLGVQPESVRLRKAPHPEPEPEPDSNATESTENESP